MEKPERARKVNPWTLQTPIRKPTPTHACDQIPDKKMWFVSGHSFTACGKILLLEGRLQPCRKAMKLNEA
jgi:hypothetical protein